MTPDNYVVPKGEEFVYHTVIEVRKFDPNTGKRLSVPRIQKFGRKMFEQTVRDELMKMGYTVTVLHDPRQAIAEREAAAARKAEDRRASEEERFNKAVAEQVAKVLAEREAAAAEQAAKNTGRRRQ